MNNTEVRTSSPQIRYIMIAAVRKITAVFFYSTKFQTTHDNTTKNENKTKDFGAADLQRLRFFFVVKSRYITFYHSRAPPPNLEIHSHFKIGGIHNDYKIHICRWNCFGS